mmetsp:Transcript_8190/g.34409  ORF Transcript_8190/g.34409 Transcript_8190/m.34409 type:complete len:470 (-) Transcript_8190:101-1510(-)|eukprot:CAMPEP_0114620866 /NCGR_PEP_ID=MMETSP0168-20121206/8942_1 /TAXON_ID=95228 ORGANISM="Vannella sp., Strain DIVA3 517/6/12" /NCGR_SAMPLE_ID=MMETSP0168 /ASSEMBLY_ACC=CAM_ASM_000044 /LENGTH=469 /DNA_ID=CAMNT_0001832063 /DNA_START=25 /DNA_END=1434 /DNA_ORIENTATION=-
MGPITDQTGSEQDALETLSDITSPIKLASGNEPCMITVNEQTYDMRNWVSSHPGGDIILQYHDKDATAVFAAFHSKEAYDVLRRFSPADTPTQMDGHAPAPKAASNSAASATAAADFETLRQELDAEGLLGKGDPMWYAMKTVTTVLLPVVAWALLALFPSSSWIWLLSATIVGLFYQQVGWLAHEFGHHQVFQRRWMNTWAAMFLVNIGAGYSLTWWKDRHNKHHGASNVLEEDPDIDNLPVFAWDERDLDRLVALNQPKVSLRTIPYQAWYFLPFLTTLHAIWALQSIRFLRILPSYKNRHIRHYLKAELITLTLHYAWLIYLMFKTPMPLITGPLFFILAEMVGGFCLGIIVFFNHYPQQHFSTDQQLTFLEMQVLSTRNIAPGVFMDWFTGGISYQIEHHLFPTMGRNYLPLVRDRVRALCKKHGLPYAEEPLISGTHRTISYLDGVAKAIIPSLQERFAHVKSH